jgi:hypothetical protein
MCCISQAPTAILPFNVFVCENQRPAGRFRCDPPDQPGRRHRRRSTRCAPIRSRGVRRATRDTIRAS